MTLQQVIEYEVKTASFFMTFVYVAFPSFLIRRCKRKLRLYNYYEQEDALEEAKKILTIQNK